jgi:hypothetical protein
VNSFGNYEFLGVVEDRRGGDQFFQRLEIVPSEQSARINIQWSYTSVIGISGHAP